MSQANMQTSSNIKIDPLLDYYYKWLNIYKDIADSRLELLERAYIIYMDTGKIPNHLLLEIHRELKYPKETEDD